MVGSTEALTSCPACGIAFPLGARFCPSCGTAIDSSVPRFEAGGLSARERNVVVPLHQTLSSAVDPLIGKVIADRYRIMSILGRGGMGVVYRAEHIHIGKLMAIKLLSGALANDPQVLRRFQREAQAVSKLTHPNTVQIFDFGEADRLAFLVMEYLPGRDLATLIAEQVALPFERVAQIAAQIAASVDEAHKAGVIHRDIKPENVMIVDTREQHDFVKVLDFGIAKLRDAEANVATQRGHLIGTPHYMAPEQIRAEGIDHRVDIYALGALMYKAVTGDTPFTADNPLEVLGKHLNEPLVPVRKRAPQRDIPEEAERIIGKALQKDPARRYQTMAALRDDLRNFLRTTGLASGAFEVEPEQLLGLGATGALATRGDVDGYERRIRRASRFGKAVGALALIAAGYGAVYLWRMETVPRTSDVESEPNDEPADANLLVPGHAVRGLLGKRRSPGEGDADVYRIELADGSPRVADFVLTALPNMDLALDLVEHGSAQPILSVNSGKLGEPERIPNVLLRGSAYYVRVREVAVTGRYPTENVSDEYTLTLTLSNQDPAAETELNDALGLAQTLRPGTPVRGLIGWNDDHDVYCAEPSSAGQTVTVSAVADLDLVLAYLDRNTSAGQRIDHHGPGKGEQIELPASSGARSSCFTVSARENEGAQRFDAKTPYEIRLGPAS
jgi:hypothetical protein